MKTILLFVIGIYRKYISPLKRRRCCKYYPTCSQYAIDAINEWGAFRGVFMAGWRILRCNPFSRGGIDYVPKRNSRKMTAGEELYRNGVKKENTEQQK